MPRRTIRRRKSRRRSLPSDPRDVDGLADVLRSLQYPKIVEKMSQVALDLAPRLGIKTHMLEVVEWLGI